VMESTSVGVVGWALPNVAILDKLGLNDRVVASSPPTGGPDRQMAHDRRAPPGYVECFSPNVQMEYKRVWVVPRPEPLTEEDVRACEARFWPQ
jgi:arabinofuranosyltransferase